MAPASEELTVDPVFKDAHGETVLATAAADVAHPHVEDLPLVVGDPEVHVGPLHADPQGDRVPLVAVGVLLDVLLVHPVVVLHNVRLLVNLLQEVVVVGIPVLHLLHRHRVEDDDVLCVYIYYIKDFFCLDVVQRHHGQ